MGREGEGGRGGGGGGGVRRVSDFHVHVYDLVFSKII